MMAEKQTGWTWPMKQRDMNSDDLIHSDVMEVLAPGRMPFYLAGMKLWENLITHLEMVQKSLRSNDWQASIRVGRTLLFLHHYLMLSRDYLELVEDLLARERSDDCWERCVLYEDAEAALSLVRLYAGAPVPLHDNPGAEGAWMVISGQVEIERYSVVSQATLDDWGEVVELSQSPRRILEQYDASLFGRENGNIQSLAARTDDCLLLRVQTPPHFSGARNWYYPLQDCDPDHVMPAKRVRASASRRQKS